MQKARAALVLRDPFLASLALRLKLVESDMFPTAATDGITLYYNPKYIVEIAEKYGDAEAPEYYKGLWFHEVFHPAMGHHVRKGARDHKLWNLACDFVIDILGVEAGYKIPDALVRKEFEGLSAEQIYPKLQQEQEEGRCPVCGKPKPGQGDGTEGECQCPGQGEGDGPPSFLLLQQEGDAVSRAVYYCYCFFQSDGYWHESFTRLASSEVLCGSRRTNSRVFSSRKVTR